MSNDTEKDTAVEMFVGGLVLDPNIQAPVVVLKDETGEISLPIWIGMTEATSIAVAIKQVSMDRPLTHDLMFDVFNQVGVSILKIVITSLKESTYYSEIILLQGETEIIVDARPSDAIALAIRASAPIFVAPDVIKEAKATINFVMAEAEHDVEYDSSQNGELDASQNGDLTAVDKEKWKRILEDLEPEDFKYKI